MTNNRKSNLRILVLLLTLWNVTVHAARKKLKSTHLTERRAAQTTNKPSTLAPTTSKPSTFPPTTFAPSSSPSGATPFPSLYPAPSPSPYKGAFLPGGQNAFGNNNATIGPWPECVGWACEDCRSYISTVADGNPVTRCTNNEYISHRVIIVTNHNGVVIVVPHRG